MKHVFHHLISCFCSIAAISFLAACSNSVAPSFSGASPTETSTTSSGSSSSCSSLPESSSYDPQSFRFDSLYAASLQEYPESGLPRLIIETEMHRKIKSTRTEIPATMKLYDSSGTSPYFSTLTIRGRGNTSWDMMPKKSYKIELTDKISFFGFPKNRDWALIANYADKTLIKNHIAYQYAHRIGLPYTPRNDFVELVLNGEYLGVYLLTETVKVGKNRVNIDSENSFLAEFDEKAKPDDISLETKNGRHITLHFPKTGDSTVIGVLKDHIDALEDSLASPTFNDYASWIDVDAYIQHYWLQELTKNPDGIFYSSVYFSWEVGKPIVMGPAWDFDLAFGGHNHEDILGPEDFITRHVYWNRTFFKNRKFLSAVNEFWETHHDELPLLLNSIDAAKQRLEKAAQNNFKRWPILASTEFKYHLKPFKTYGEAIEDFKDWLNQRIQWIDAQMDTPD